MKISLPALATLVVVSTSLQASAQSNKVERASLPPAVEKTVQTYSQGATIKDFLIETEDGKKVETAWQLSVRVMVSSPSAD